MTVQQYDAVVMGAGVAGLYQLYQLRKAGLNVVLFEAGSDVGGTWYWNRYPGARFDSESLIYQYIFDEKLYKDWSWSERFPGQPEIEKWLQYVTERLDLRKDIKFNSRISSAHYNETTKRWTIKTENGDTADSQFFVSCGGMLSAPITGQFPDQDKFKGTVVYTSKYPKEGVDVAGKRVGVVGIGATGIQVIQATAPKAGHLTVFARTPQYTLPMKNPTYNEEDQEEYKKQFDTIKEVIPTTFSGFQFDFTKSFHQLSPEERLKHMEEVYAHGSLKFWLAAFPEQFFEKDVSREVSEFVASKQRARLNNDPELIKILVPDFEKDYGFGTHVSLLYELGLTLACPS